MAEIEDIYPLSATQQGMLFHALYTPETGAYFEQMALGLRGEIDRDAFRAAWRAVVQRHTVLRTAFDWESMDEPVQVVLSEAEPGLVEEDWRHVGELESALEARLRDDRERGFDLAAAPLLRFALLRTGEHEHQLIWSHHHLVLDGWSMPLLFRDFFLAYRAATGHGAPLAASLPEPRPYRDYIAWLQQQDPAAAEAFWRAELAGFKAPTGLGIDRPGAGPASASAYAEHSLGMGAATTAALTALAQREKLTTNTIVQGAWALVLARLSGDSDVLFGAVTAGRPPELAGVESMVGLFLNTLPLRLAVPAEAELGAWLREVQEHFLAVLRHEFSPLAEVSGWSEVPRGTPLFESLLIFQNYPVDAAAWQGSQDLAITDFRIFERTNYPLSILARPGEELSFAVRFDSARFAPAAIDELLRQLRSVLEQVAALGTGAGGSRLGEISLVTPDAQQWLPDPTRELPAPDHELLPARFAAVAAATPEALAIDAGTLGSWTYGRLAAAVTTLSGTLAACPGFAPGTVVAVTGDRSPGLVAAALAVFTAGGTLVLLDPALAEERRARFLAVAAPAFLLAVGTGARETGPWRTLEVDPSTAETASGEVLAGPLPGPEPDDAAYLFFTSGTTGRPKAVVGRHRGLAHFLAWQRAAYDVGPGDRVGQLTALSFDVVLRDLFLPLTSGATLCLPPAELGVASPEAPRWLAAVGATVLHTVPSLVRAWSAVPAGSVSLAALRVVFFAGEPLTAETVEGFRASFEVGGRIVNLYGPTETTLAKCHHEVIGTAEPGVQPIGEALPDTQLLVLGPGDRLCGVGEPGEIVVRTPFRSLGYLEAEVGAARFVPNPFTDDFGDIVYRTGDLGRYRADGRLTILGRLDDQLKIHGVRVEPGEIEAVIARHAGVREVVVAAPKDSRGEVRLAAYVVPAAGWEDRLAPEELALLARENLPEALVPAGFVLLPALPLSANGKLDREALPPLPHVRQASTASYLAPRDALELDLVRIWEEVLEVSPVGVRDSFFSLGGHSLLVAPLLGRVERRFARRLTLAQFFPVPTVERMAAALHQTGVAADSPLVAFRTPGPTSRQRPLFLVHPLGGSSLCYQTLVERLPEVPLFGLDATYLAGRPELPASLEDLAGEYVAALRTAGHEGPFRLGGWSFGGLVAFEMARQLVATGERVELLALFDSHIPAFREEPLAVDDALILAELVGHKLGLGEDELRALPAESLLDHVLAKAIGQGALPAGYDLDTAREALRVVRGLGLNSRRYRPAPTAVRITYFQARGAEQAPHLRTLEQWRELSTGGALDLRVVDGSHESLLDPPQVDGLARELASVLAELPP
jgi:amino acid adenylation domain-containing protein